MNRIVLFLWVKVSKEQWLHPALPRCYCCYRCCCRYCCCLYCCCCCCWGFAGTFRLANPSALLQPARMLFVTSECMWASRSRLSSLQRLDADISRFSWSWAHPIISHNRLLVVMTDRYEDRCDVVIQCHIWVYQGVSLKV